MMATENVKQLEEKLDDYDPHEHRVINVKKATNNFETLVHLLKCSLGTGILALPQSFTRAGLVTGIFGTIAMGVMLTHCLHMLLKMQYKVCKIRRVAQLTYPEVLEYSMMQGPVWLHPFAKPFAASIDVFNVSYQVGACCVYIVFIAENIKKMIDPVTEIPLLTYMLIMVVPLIALNLVPTLKAMAPLSLVANLLSLLGVAVIVYFLLVSQKAADNDPIDYWGTPTQVPLFFGTMLFALTSVPVVVAIERTMKTPKDYTKFFGVLNGGLGFIVVLYVGVGSIGYLYCKSECSDSITLDMPSGAPALIVQFLMALSILISYGLHCFVPVDLVFTNYVIPILEKNNATEKKKTVVEYSLRVGTSLFTIITAILVPRLGLFISLCGAFCLSTLGMCYPTLMEICLSYPNNYGPVYIYLFKDIFLFLVGLMGLFTGTYTSIAGIVRSFF